MRFSKSKVKNDTDQLELFSCASPDEYYPVWPNVRASLVGASVSESPSDGNDHERNGTDHSTVSPKGLLAADGTRTGQEDRSEPVRPAPPEAPVIPNARNYRIRPEDRVGTGSLKQKFRQNLAAIETLQRIEGRNRAATDEEKAVLVLYAGWGGMPHVFASVPPTDWKKPSQALSQLLKPEEWESSRASTLNSHYTSPEIIRAIYAGVERLGFKGGRILEPACGVGHFIGLMPETIHAQSSITGVELDTITARIAGHLYPDADIRHSGFEKTTLPDGSFDLAISNIPFGDFQPYDPRFNARKYPIHDYFFAATLERIRPGGLIVFITSKGTLDKQDSRLRKSLSKQADLITAIRLPNTTFKSNAHTEVTTDLIILRKRMPGEAPSSEDWQDSCPYTNERGEEMPLNQYFIAHPRQMLGKMTLEGRMYGRQEATLSFDGRDPPAALAEALLALPENLYQAKVETVTPVWSAVAFPVVYQIKPNGFALSTTDTGTQIARRDGNQLVPVPHLPATVANRIRGLIRLRDATRECLRTQVDDAPEAEIVEARRCLNREYDLFHMQFGAISEPANVRAFTGDPDLPLLLSLEAFNEKTGLAKKTALFRERTIQPSKPVDFAETPKEALLHCLNEQGKVDLPYMSRLLGKPVEEFLPELKGVIFLDPQTESWKTDDDYLSGHIRQKLALAEKAAESDPRYRDNVEALKSVQPEELKATEIDARLGSVWIPASDIECFAHELLNLLSSESVQVRHAPELGAWTLQADYSAKSAVANTTEWGTARYGAVGLIEDALNLRTPTVYDPHPDDRDKRIINLSATEAARDKQQKIKERFGDWIWQDDGRRERLVKHYNETFNNIRVRTFNGDHLTLPGANPNVVLRPHQKAAVWRVLQTPNTLLAHVVGAGKTYTMVAAAMEAKRLGLCHKPLFVVPNHMLGQFSSELLNLYPCAQILVAGKDDFEADKRARLFSRIATGNWDAVIVTHSGFERLPLSVTAQGDFLREQIKELEDVILRQQGDRSFVKLVKQLESAKKRLETRLKELSAEQKKDQTLTFEELGIDRLFVDEAHYFKNLFYVSKMTRISGLPQTSSQRAFDMFLKVRYVQEKAGGGGVVFATGTPVTNTMAEMYTMQRYLQPGDLKGQDLQHFDSWAATYGEPVTAMELSPDGAGYRLHTRFARFVNVPELMQQFRQMADIQTAQTLQLPVPKLSDGKPTIVSAPATPDLKAFVASLVKRAERLKASRVDPSEDNMLKVTGDGRKAALDLRLVGRFADQPNSKINLASRKIFEIWDATRTDRLTQLVFCDLSTPKAEGEGFSAYNELRGKLIQKGVPETEIAFIQDYDSDTAKASLFKRVRSGQVRVLLGSSQKMGTGTNVQERLIALHHLDAPWRPSDIEQREGRILRQGNRNDEVRIFRYVTEGSFDAYMWGVLETKAKFIAQVMTNQSHVRKIEDLDSPALTYAEVKAIASGNPLVIEKAQVDTEVMRLTRLRSQHNEMRYITRASIRRAETEIPRIEETIKNLETDLAARQPSKGNTFSIKIGKQIFRDREKAGEMLNFLATKHHLDSGKIQLGTFGGFPLVLWPDRTKEIILQGQNAYMAKVSDSPLGTIASLEYALRSLDDCQGQFRETLSRTKRELTDLRPHAEKPFEHEGRLAELVRRQQEIVESLDLTKNQAAAKIEETANQDNIAEEPAALRSSSPRRPRTALASFIS